MCQVSMFEVSPDFQSKAVIDSASAACVGNALESDVAALGERDIIYTWNGALVRLRKVNAAYERSVVAGIDGVFGVADGKGATARLRPSAHLAGMWLCEPNAIRQISNDFTLTTRIVFDPFNAQGALVAPFVFTPFSDLGVSSDGTFLARVATGFTRMRLP